MLSKQGDSWGVIPGELPLGQKNGQIYEHWDTTTKWWLKFGMVDAAHEMDKGINLEPMKALFSEAANQ